MPRPSLAEIRRPQILEAFVAAVADYGVEGATLDVVAAEAGVTRGLVRHYLGNRDNVLRALGQYVRDSITAKLQDSLAHSAPEERLESLLDRLFGAIPESLWIVASELFSVAARDEQVAAMLRETYLELERAIDSELAAAFPRAALDDRRRVAFALLCLATAGSDFQMLSFPADRPRSIRTTADGLITSLS